MVPELISQCAVRHGDRTALCFRTVRAELCRAGAPRQPARTPAALGSPGSDRTRSWASALLRSVELVVAILGVLKAGGAYLPLDPELPPARLAEQVAEAGAGLLLTHGPTEAVADELLRVLGRPTPRWSVDRDWPSAAADSTGEPPRHRPDPDNLAYVIFTSGSTGRPKGVGVAHAGWPTGWTGCSRRTS